MDMLTQKQALPRLPSGAGRDRPLVDFFAEASASSISRSVLEASRDYCNAGHVHVSPPMKQSPAKGRKNKAAARKVKSPVKAPASNPASARDTVAGGLGYHSHAPNLQTIPPPLELLVRK